MPIAPRHVPIKDDRSEGHELNFKNVLLLSNLDTELGDPFFRLGAFKTYLLPIAQGLSEAGAFDIRFMLNKHIYHALLREKVTSLREENCFICDLNTLREKNITNFMTGSYAGIVSAAQKADATVFVDDAFAGWVPDLILCWEAPTELFREMFPTATVIDLMPSVFARPPFPRAIALDPTGLYAKSWFAPQHVQAITASDSQLDCVYDLRTFYQDHFSRIEPEKKFRHLLSLQDDATVALVPLQISDYFGYRDNCAYRNQFDFLEAVASSAPENTIICTQYVGGFVSERAITPDNLAYLQNSVADVRYSTEFEKLDSVSQYLVPWVDSVYSVSSTLGLQAKFFGKKLISPSTSHLRYIADAVELGATPVAHRPLDGDAFMGVYLTRGIVLYERLTRDPAYLLAVLSDIVDRNTRRATAAEVLPDEKIVGNSVEQFVLHSKLAPSERNLRKLFPVPGPVQSEAGHQEAMKSLSSAEVTVASFDIFDTLVRRTVQKPEDVFAMMQSVLVKEHGAHFPAHFLWRFAELRQATERLVRQHRDAELLVNGSNASEEITIHEVYAEMAICAGAPDIDVEMLVRIEQEIELSVLKPRPIGRMLYDLAVANGKRIVITSDFIHPLSFIEHVLRQCGYEGFEKLFLSSAIGKKKHSGDLFDEVVKSCAVSPKEILHIGDNPTGDVKSARTKSLRALLIPSAREFAKEALATRKIMPGAFDKSFMLRAVLSQFSNRFIHSDMPRHRLDEVPALRGGFELISTRQEFGFLVMGPMMHFFSNWIIDQAIAENKTQVLFFARDCILPYQMCRDICEARGLTEKLKLIYVPTSRKSVTGLDLFVPEDLLKVRIDDFTANGSLERLLMERFLLSPKEIGADLLARWGLKDLSGEKRSVLPAVLYGLVLDVARRSWTTLGKRYQQRRERFADYLSTHSEVDFDAPTAAVDFGYQGSIHRKIGGLFQKPLLPLFFMTYGDGFGQEPIRDARTFYTSNLNPLTRSNVCVTHNLILETLLNEGKGSAVEIVQLSGGGLEVVRDHAVSSAHARAIAAIHDGARKFSRMWLDECAPLDTFGRFETDSLLYFFSLVMSRPTETEVWLLSDLVFDNSFAGVKDIAMIGKTGADPAARTLWPEGVALLAKTAAVKKPAGAQKIVVNKTNSVAFHRRPLIPIVRYFVGKLGNEKDLKTFDYDPSAFFQALKNPRYRLTGRLLFPVSK